MRSLYSCKWCAYILGIDPNAEAFPTACPGTCGRPTTWQKIPVVKDSPTSPSHYKSANGIEAIDVLEAALGVEGCANFCRGNAMKYLFRGGKKGPVVEDLEKARWYINHEIKLRTKGQNGNADAL